MSDFLIYDGKVAVALLVFYLFYRFLLKKETFHRLNRVVMVGTAVLSFLLPLCVITIRRPAEPGVLVMEMTAEMRELAPVVSVKDSFPSLPILLLILLFWAGAAFVIGRMIVSILSISKIIRKGELVSEEDGCKIIVTDRDIDPFSWMRYIVLSRKDWEGDHTPILSHEKAHISNKHSVELLLVDLLSVPQWFNPAIWMLRADLKELHEYEADDAVLRSGVNIKDYQYLLIRKAISKSGYSVANSFNHSILKNRITMMSKSKSPRSRGLQVLWALPLVCLAIGLQARTLYVPTDRDSDNPQKTVTIKIGLPGRAVIDGKEIPWKDFAEYFHSMDVPVQDIIVKVDYAKDTPSEVMSTLRNYLRDAGVQKVQYNAFEANPVYILHSASGKEEEITKEDFAKIDPRKIESVDIVRNSEAIERKYGDRSKDGVMLITLKSPQELEEIVVVSYAEKNNNAEYVRLVPTEPDTMPTFQGEDMMAFSRWLNTKIARPKGCEHVGVMKVSFVVGSDGVVRDITVDKSVCEALDAMVVSNIKKSPKWEPATLNGKPVEQSLSIPIVFQMR
ncbi:MAG: energy transducer TonB [Bacteroidales bacterium]|nr:energy transducer TonB [Bacteroidales bacterium]